jgi:hypothetical protein
MPRIELIPARKAGPELRQAYRNTTRLWGAAAGPPMALQIVQCFSQRPHFVEHVARGYHYTGWCGTLPRTVRETVAVLVSRFNDCFY